MHKKLKYATSKARFAHICRVYSLFSAGTKKICLGLSIILFSHNALSDSAVELDLSYKENSEYWLEQELLTDMSMAFAGDLDTVPESIRSLFSVASKVRQKTSHSIKTGAKDSNQTYPLSMQVDRSETFLSINGADYTEIPSGISAIEGLTINGVVDADGKIEYRSASGDGATEELKAILKLAFEQLANANNIADQRVNVGESISAKLPMSIPAGELGTFNFNMEMLYTLKSIKQDIAYFDINFRSVLSTELEEAGVIIDGFGSGEMRYDIVNKFAPSVRSKMTMALSIPFEQAYLKITSVSDSNIKTSINEDLTNQADGT